MSYPVKRLSGTGVAEWNQAVSAAYFTLETDCPAPDSFYGEIDIWPCGPVDITRIVCGKVLYRRTAHHLRGDQESSLLISAPFCSEVNFRQFSRQTTCRSGSFIVERSDAPYEFEQKQGDELLVVKVPTDSLTIRMGSLQRFVALGVDARVGMASYFLSSLRHTAGQIDALDQTGREAVGAHLLELLCMALSKEENFLQSQSRTAMMANQRLAEEFIRSNLKDPELSPEKVAEACGLSLRYLQRLFANAEHTISGYIRACRLARCHEDLQSITQSDSIAYIAYRWGFSDQAQFGRHYRNLYGCTPRETRRHVVGPNCNVKTF